MHSELNTETEIDLAVMRTLALTTRQRKPWLSAICDLIEDEVELLERRGVVSAPRLDVATDIGMAVLNIVFEDDAENATPADTGVLKTLT